MYKPKFNKVLIEIDDKDAEWGKSSDGSFSDQVYREGKALEIGMFLPTADYPLISSESVDILQNHLEGLVGKNIMWNEGHEAGTVFEENGKKYCLIYWWDVIGVKE